MLLDRLWIRIKGEFLALKEDLTGEGDVRQRAEWFLEKLEQRLGDAPRDDVRTDDIDARLSAVLRKLEKGTATETHADASEEVPSVEELHETWEELRQLRDKRSAQAPAESPLPPNPRRLG